MTVLNEPCHLLQLSTRSPTLPYQDLALRALIRYSVSGLLFWRMKMSLTEEQKEIARQIATRMDDEVGLEQRTTNWWPVKFASRFLAALPKPEPVGYLHPCGGYLPSEYLDTFASGLEKETYTIPIFTAPQPDYKTQRDAESQAAKDVLAERHRQQSVEGWTPEHDDQHENGELALAAAAYALNSVRSHQSPPHWWPWAPEWWKPTTARRDLVKAAAMILARVEQIDRAEITSVKGCE